MNKERIIDYGLRVFFCITFAIGIFASAGFTLFGISIMNLIFVILSFDEFFVTSPFNQTKIIGLKMIYKMEYGEECIFLLSDYF